MTGTGIIRDLVPDKTITAWRWDMLERVLEFAYENQQQRVRFKKIWALQNLLELLGVRMKMPFVKPMFKLKFKRNLK